jgi:hypothetical protein
VIELQFTAYGIVQASASACVSAPKWLSIWACDGRELLGRQRRLDRQLDAQDLFRRQVAGRGIQRADLDRIRIGGVDDEADVLGRQMPGDPGHCDPGAGAAPVSLCETGGPVGRRARRGRPVGPRWPLPRTAPARTLRGSASETKTLPRMQSRFSPCKIIRI